VTKPTGKPKGRPKAVATFAPPEESKWLELFLEFIGHLTVDSKESGVGPLVLYGSQRRFLAEMIDGLNRDIHMFVNLKAMQLGISTISLAVDLFWLAVHPGMQGVLVTDTEGNKEKFRIILKRFIASLPASYRIQLAKGGDNRNHMVFENGSVLDFLTAGTRRSATEVGRSRAYNFAHCTEVANYGAIEGIVSLIDRLAEKHPHRLYIFESTAKGFNLFWQLWEKAKVDPVTQKAFFIGWWAKEDYSVEEDSPLFKRYWDGTLDEEEQLKVNLVYEKYGVRITPGQLAWYRWKSDQSSESSLMDQNFPWDEDDAFLQTGQQFFPTKKMVQLVRQLSDNPPPMRGYAYEFGEVFMGTKIQPVRTADEAQLKIYEQPSEIGQYVMGIDPAYGRSENQDRSVIQVFRCYADRLVQVAEFASASPESYQVAWPLAHLAGIYKNVIMILEVSGPGEATFLELKHLRQLFDAGMMPQPAGGGIDDLFGAARFYMYHRSDSPGPGYAYNWKTTGENKMAILNQLRDSLTLGMVEIRSIQCAIELQSMVQDGFVIEPAISSGKDDRVMGSAFAHRAWTDWVRGQMIDANDTWERVTEREAVMAEGSTETMVSHIVSAFFQGKVDERDDAEIESMWNN
jgi:hypothetical protein